MNREDAAAMVAQLFSRAPQEKRDLIVMYMLQEQVNALHAAWMLFGRVKGLPCACTPCLSAPRVGVQIHGGGVTTVTSMSAQQAHDLGALLLLAAEDAQKADRCADCGAPADDKCPNCGKLVCNICAEREGESCCDGDRPTPDTASAGGGVNSFDRWNLED